MRRFILGSSVEVLPVADDENGTRKKFLDSVWKTSRLDQKLPGMAVSLCARGRLLVWLRPVGAGGYRLQWFKRDQYRAYYNAEEELESVVIIYSYKKQQLQGAPKLIWVRIRITLETIETQESETKYDFDKHYTPPNAPIQNLLGFLPCREALNTPPVSEEIGEPDFKDLSLHLQTHDEQIEVILENLDYFAVSPILTDMDAAEISEQIFEERGNSTARDLDSTSYASGFRTADELGTTRRGRKPRRRLKRVIGGLGDEASGGLFRQLDVNPVPQDLILFADNYEKQLREALGGTLERGIETATETSVVYGKVQASAAEKRRALLDYCICELLSMALLAEEALFLSSKGEMGLPPLGDRGVRARVGPVYIEQPQSTLNRSIVGRNLQRLGVNAMETLKYVLPDKHENEIKRLVSSGGLPVEYLGSVIEAMSKLNSTIDPLTSLPLADPVTGAPLLSTLIPFITNALTYGSDFNSTDNASESTSPATAAAESRALRGSDQRAAIEQFWRQLAEQRNLDEIADRSLAAIEPSAPAPGSTLAAGKPDANHDPTTEPSTGFFNLANSPILKRLRGRRAG